ncbi:MAG: TIM barrel protein [Sporomusaceae bacterium]|nr:TIM barrel protein [Sporomusaceae bacterium]
MLQLVNLSNYECDLELIAHDPDKLRFFLESQQLDGIEMMFHQNWDSQLHPKQYIYGAHLHFWPCWLDFWQNNQENLLADFGSSANISACYGAATPELWLENYRKNLQLALTAGVKYVVFHVGHVRPKELFSWDFQVSNQSVVDAACEVANLLCADLPEDVMLCFENLWWPGLTLLDPKLAERLLTQIHHKNSGFLLDTGHLMNTNQALRTEEEGIAYVLNVLKKMGSLSNHIRVIHLHKSLSGLYVEKTQHQSAKRHELADVMAHVLQIDQHLPFTSSSVCKIVEATQPDYLVHEFMQSSWEDWQQKVSQQQQALQPLLAIKNCHNREILRYKEA